MRRSLYLLILSALAGAALLGVSYSLCKTLCARHLACSGDDLEWLRQEFRLTSADMQSVRQLHQGYQPKCREMCAQIAAKKAELQATLDTGPGVTPEAEQKLSQLAALRAQCQAQMLRHFQEVSQVMPPEQGRRYLTEMQRLTLGFHEQFEHSMAGSSPHGHH